MSPDEIAAFTDVADVVTSVTILLVLATLFFRGDIISRKVYDTLIQHSIDKTARELSDKVVDGIAEKIEDRVRMQQEVEKRLAAIADEIKLSNNPPGSGRRKR